MRPSNKLFKLNVCDAVPKQNVIIFCLWMDWI